VAGPSQSAASSYSNELSASTSNREQAVLSNFRSLFALYRNNRGAANSSCFSTLQKASRPSTSRRTNRHVPYRIKETWTHEFICLENPDQKVVPSRNQKLNLQTAGLGRKKIVFGNKDDALKFKNTIESVFPKLASGGGFEILRIPVPSLGYSVPYLRDHSGLGQALAYIRPLQARLDLSPAEVDQVNQKHAEVAILRSSNFQVIQK
jgi:hypothetical protein